MSREDHARSIEHSSAQARARQQWRPLQLRHHGEFQQVSTTAITAVWSESLWGLRKTVLATNDEESGRAMAADCTTKVLVSPPSGEFLHNYCVVLSLHDGNHGGVVRIFVGHSKVIKQ